MPCLLDEQAGHVGYCDFVQAGALEAAVSVPFNQKA